MEKAALIIYAIVLVISPLLFGAINTYAYTMMSVGVLTASFLLVIKNVKKDKKTSVWGFSFPGTSLNFLFLIILAFLIFQVVPLPDSLLGLLSPEAEVVGGKSIPASGIAVKNAGFNEWFSLSPYYYPVRMSIVRWIVYGLFFFGLIQVLNSRKRIEALVILILILACFDTLYGLMETYSGSHHIWWYKKKSYLEDVTGTYINHNHFAGLMEMCLLLAAAYVASLSERKRKRKTAARHKTSLRRRISQLLSGEQRFNKRILVLFSAVVIGIGLFFSSSRGGILAASGAMLCMSLLFVFRKAHRQKGLILLFLFLIISVYALHIGADYTLGRFEYFDQSFKERSRYAKKTLDMFYDYKTTGVGVGNFRYAYPKYQAIEDRIFYMRHATNDWVEFLADAGIIGMCLLLAGISYYLYRIMKLWKKRTDPFAIGLGVAPVAAMTAIAIHSYSDFNLHFPANFLVLVAIVAIGYSALHLERHHGRDKTFIRYHIQPLKYKGFLTLFFVSGIVVWSGFWAVRHFVAECYCNTVTEYSSLNRDIYPSLKEIQSAIAWDASNARYWQKLVVRHMRFRESRILDEDWDIEDRRKLQMEIIGAFEKAVTLNPFEPQYHARLGWEYSTMMEDPDHQEKWLRAADISMERAAFFAGDQNPGLHIDIGNYWVVRSKQTIGLAISEHRSAWAKACWHYKKAQSLGIENRKALRDRIVEFVWKFYPDYEIVSEVVLSVNKP